MLESRGVRSILSIPPGQAGSYQFLVEAAAIGEEYLPHHTPVAIGIVD
jgi:hypothetical protein